MSEAVQNPQSSGPPAKRVKTMPAEVTIEQLPRETLVQVMKYVRMAQWPSLESVSHTFRDTIFEMWRTVRKINLREDLVIASVDVNTEAINLLLEKLIRRAPSISDIGGFGLLDEHSIDLLVRFEKLERVEFHGQCAPLNELGRFLKESASRNQLNEVSAANYKWWSIPPDQEALSEAFHGENGLAPLKLETFDFSRNWKLGWSFLSVVDVSRLTSFNIIDTHVSRSLFVSFLNRAIKLERLEFSFSCLENDQQYGVPVKHAEEPGPTQWLLQLNKTIIREVGNLKNLVSLTMGTYARHSYGCGCRNFDDEMVRLLERLGGRGNMKELSLWQMGPVTSQLALCVATALTNLSSLEMNIGRCDEAALERMLKAQKSLVSLKLCDINASPTRVIPHTTANAHSLKVLDLRYGWGVIPKEELLQICTFMQLKELRVSHYATFPNVDAILVGWAEAFGSTLETLEISQPLGGGISDRGFLPLIKKMRRLRKLHISHSKITDRSLKEMAAGCRDTRDLNVAYSCNITIEGVQAVIDGCEYLQVLDVSGGGLRSPGALKIPKYWKISILL